MRALNRSSLILSLALAGCPAPAVTNDAGTVPNDAGGTDGGGGTDTGVDGGGGTDTGVDGGGGGTDTGVDGGGTGVDADVPCAPTVVELAGITTARGLAISGSRLFTTSGGDVVSYALDGTGLQTLIPAAGSEMYADVAVGGTTVVGTTAGGGTTIARAPSDGSGSVTTFDLMTYAAYQAVTVTGPFAYSPRSGRVLTDGTTIFLEERTYGGLIAFDATTLAPLGFLFVPGPDSPLTGLSAWVLNGHRIVTTIDRTGSGLTALTGQRTFDVTTPAAMTQSGQVVRSAMQTAMALTFDAAGARYIFTTLFGVYRFTVDASGVPTAGQLMFATSGPQARGVAVVDGAFVVGSPQFSPMDYEVAILGEIPAGLEARGMVAVTTTADVVVGGTGEAFAANANSGGPIARITLTGCP